MNRANNRKYLVSFLFALSVILYARTLNYGFVWDDERIHLTNNQQLMEGDVKSFWLKPYSGMYIPVSYSTWSYFSTITSAKNELSSASFHLLNIVVHSINCILVFYLLLILFKNQRQAFIGSLIFLCHPIQVESVAWISEFRGLYSVFFSLLSLITIFRFLQQKKLISVRMFITSKHFIFSTLFFTLAILAKPSAIILPLIAVILIWCFNKENLKALLTAFSIWILVILPVVLITINSQPNEGIYDFIPFWKRFLIAGDALFFYVNKLIFPYPLAACYGFTPELILSSKFIYVGTIVCFTLALVSFVKRKTYPTLFSGFVIIIICILPVSGLIPFEYQKHSTVADRYLYFGMLGLTLFVPFIEEMVKKHAALKYILGCILIIFLVLTIQQTNTWKNEFTVWDNTLTHYQNSAKVYYNRGVENSKMGNFEAAIRDYTACLKLQSDYLDAIFNRANAYENINNNNLAFADYTSYLLIDSTDGSVYYKRAYLNYKTGNINEATKDAERAEILNFPLSNKFKALLKKHE